MSVKILITNILFLLSLHSFAQDIPKIVLPSGTIWNQLKEGEQVDFDLNVEGKNCNKFRFSIQQGKVEGMDFDSSGKFTWTPSYSLVDRLDSYKFHQVIFEAKCDSTNETLSAKVEFRVQHVNRSPTVRDLKPFYVQYNTNNTYKIDRYSVIDEDNDPIVVIPSIESLPEGLKISSQGEVSWMPSFTQFKKLKENPIHIEFYVEDQPTKSQTKGKLKIETTQQDLAPEIVVVPRDNVLRIRENQSPECRHLRLGRINRNED